MTRESAAVLSIRDLSIRFENRSGGVTVVDQASLQLGQGEIHGLVGESGSGKTMVARSILGLLPPGAVVSHGTIEFKGQPLQNASLATLRKLRGSEIGMVFQEPMMSLNPALKIGRQMAEAMQLHTDLSDVEIRNLSVEMLERIRMPNPRQCLKQFPHEFSGGMRQRIMLASVLMSRPSLLLADEPTTALDVLIQQEVLEIMLEIVRDLGTTVLLITHDLGLVAKYARSMTVLKRGVVVEQGSVKKMLARPERAYTQQLLEALPRRLVVAAGEATPKPQSGTPLVEVNGLRVTFSKPSLLPWRPGSRVHAVDGVSFDIHACETLAVVGESGSGKTTLGRAVLKLVDKSAGKICVDGRDMDELSAQEMRALRRELQIVFQDPYSSLDPRKRIGQIVGEGLGLIPGLSRDEKRKRVNEVLTAVDIDANWSGRFPHELSGGQRQRIGIARAIVTQPRLIVADEAVSALDLTVQAQVLKLFKDLQNQFRFSYLFITHDLGVVEQIADRIMVMYRGQLVEIGSRDDIFDRPAHPYTCSLLNAVPELSGNTQTGFSLSQKNFSAPPPPRGFSHDLRYAGDFNASASLIEVSVGHFAAFSSCSNSTAALLSEY